MKLGGELELRDVDIKTSTIEARKLFLNLVLAMKPEVGSDLMRLFNKESLPRDVQEQPNLIDFSAKFFLLHTKKPHCYSVDLTEFGYKPEVRQTPVLAYFDFIFRNQAEFDQRLIESEKEWKSYTPNPYQELITRSALEKLIPDWKTLQSKDNSKLLCSELSQWAEKWNLTDDWCFDFALHCLKLFKINLIDKCWFPDNYLESKNIYSLFELRNFWYDGRAWRESVSDLSERNLRDYFFTSEIPNYPKLNYVWELKTEKGTQEILSLEGYYNPLHMYPENFRREIEERFWARLSEFLSFNRFAFVGNSKLLIDELSKFQKSVDDYISYAEELMKPHADRTVVKRSGDKHFRWLVEYQILGKSYNKLAAENDVDRRAVRDGIKNVSEIIELTLRDLSLGGKQKGAVDKVKGQRRRVAKA
jgi:ribosomal protein L20A (L18A)